MVEAKIEKRNRPPKSCEPCRIRKLKCNRELPCDTCSKRGSASGCRYAANADRDEKRGTPAAKTVSGRLKRLEDLVTKMAREDSAVLASTNSQALPTTTVTSHGTVILHSNDASRGGRPAGGQEPLSGGLLYSATASYTDSSHWSSLMEEIKGIREQLSSPAVAEPAAVDVPLSPSSSSWPPADDSQAGTELVFVQASLSLPELTRKLPARPVCDRLVAFYFRLGHPILPVLHPPTFQKEYATFWDNHDTAPPLWVALLFAVLAVATSLENLASSDAKGVRQFEAPPEVFGDYAKQCLVIGSYATAHKYSLEALIVLLQSNYLYANDTKPNLWFLIGIVLRLAVSRGYHRDPARLPSSQLTPFDAEMRRRVWITIFQVDSLVSFQMGLPSLVPWEFCDTELPRNLEYSELSPDMKHLPPSRPLTDATPILYTIVKARFMAIFKSIVGHTRSLAPRPYGDTMALDCDLRQAYTALPENFKYRPLDQCLIDAVMDIMNRATIELLYMKSIIVLHRKYITILRQDPAYSTSRQACIEAACTVLQRQAELHQATQPGGLLYNSKWMISTLTANDFILAAMIVCLELTIQVKEGRFSADGPSPYGQDSLLYALRVAHDIWTESAAFSLESRIAAGSIQSTIQRVEAHSLTERHARDTTDSAHVPDTLVPVDPMLEDMDYINWTFLDNNYSDPLNTSLDLDSWMMDATRGSGQGI